MKHYIIVRNDMHSMTPGRIAAQAAHATSALHTFDWDVPEYVFLKRLFAEWSDETEQGFGTTIVLSASPEEIFILNELLENFSKKLIYAEVINDPDYVIKDGLEIFSASVNTCFSVFGITSENNSEAQSFIDCLPLYKG